MKALTAVCLALLAGCGGGGSKTVATVGGDEITAKQLDALVAHFRAEAKLEGKPFPEEGSAQLLGRASPARPPCAAVPATR
jgi:hypothetical protein